MSNLLEKVTFTDPTNSIHFINSQYIYAVIIGIIGIS